MTGIARLEIEYSRVDFVTLLHSAKRSLIIFFTQQPNESASNVLKFCAIPNHCGCYGVTNIRASSSLSLRMRDLQPLPPLHWPCGTSGLLHFRKPCSAALRLSCKSCNCFRLAILASSSPAIRCSSCSAYAATASGEKRLGSPRRICRSIT